MGRASFICDDDDWEDDENGHGTPSDGTPSDGTSNPEESNEDDDNESSGDASSYTEADYVICGPYHLRFHEGVVVIWRHERNIFIELPSGSNGWWRFRTYDGVRYF